MDKVSVVGFRVNFDEGRELRGSIFKWILRA